MHTFKDDLAQYFVSIGLGGYELGLIATTLGVIILVIPDIRSKEKVAFKHKVIDTWITILFFYFLFEVINKYFF